MAWVLRCSKLPPGTSGVVGQADAAGHGRLYPGNIAFCGR